MSEIRMYVELLFEGRTMTREAIDLKEEIYGNLMARYEDLLAQGVSEAEALERTKASITSVDDVLGSEGADTGATDADAPSADATMAGVTVPLPGGSDAGASAADAGAPAVAVTRRRPSTGMVVAIAGGVFLVLVAVVVALGVAGGRAYETVGSGTAVIDQRGTGGAGSATDASNSGDATTTDGATGTTTTTTDGKTTGGTSGSTTTGGTVPSDALYAEVAEGSADVIAPYAGTSLSDTARVEELVRALPLGTYVTEVATDASRGTATITYTYEDRDYVARDDDYVDLALVYDATALMSAMGDLDSVTVIEVETKDHDYDRDVVVFERAVMEALLGTSLSPDQLAGDAWDAVRAKVTTKRVWNEIWERSERD